MVNVEKQFPLISSEELISVQGGACSVKEAVKATVAGAIGGAITGAGVGASWGAVGALTTYVLIC